MSSRGEIVPELAAILLDIAQRVKEGTTDKRDDSDMLRAIARSVAGDDPAFELRLHRKLRGRAPYKAVGVDRDLQLARLVKGQIESASETGTEEDACRAVASMRGVTVGWESIQDAWQRMKPLLKLDDKSLNPMLFFLRLKANGMPVKIERVERPSK